MNQLCNFAGIGLVALLGLTGCATTATHVVELKGIPEAIRVEPAATIQIYGEGEEVPSPYVVVGKVFMYTKKSLIMFGTTSESAMAKSLRKKAKTIGADALMGVHSSRVAGKKYDKSMQRWTSALAIGFVDDIGTTTNELVDLAVTILPVTDEREVIPTKYEHSKEAQEIIQYHLENRGYYATLADSDELITRSSLQAMSEEDLLDCMSSAKMGQFLLRAKGHPLLDQQAEVNRFGQSISLDYTSFCSAAFDV